MDVNRLLSDELTYELLVRGCVIGDTVAEKRAALREAQRIERIIGIRSHPTVVLDRDQEKNICEHKLNDIEMALTRIDYGNIENEFKRLLSRLIFR